MKNSKSGISLIVLVITIIIIIVLATAIIVNVVKNNPIEKANEARIKGDFSTMNDELAVYIANQYLKDSKFDPKKLNADSTTIPSVYDIITTLKGSRYEGYVSIANGKIVVSDDMEGSDLINGAADGNNKEDERVDSTSDLWDFNPTTGTIYYYKGTKEQLNIENNTIKIPTHIDGVEVKILGNYRPIFSGSMMNFNEITGEKLKLPNTLQVIGNSAFGQGYGSGFAGELIIPDSVTSIESGAFEGCIGFTGELVIPKNVTNIGSNAFRGCTGFSGKITILSNEIKIWDFCFDGTKFTKLDLAIKDIKEESMGIFNQYSNSKAPLIEEIILRDSVESIGDYSFQGIKTLTKELIIPASVKTIGGYAFDGTGLTKVNIMGATTIGSCAFMNCASLVDISLPNTLTNIGYCAFQKCIALKNIYIPDSVTLVDNGAFSDCTALETVSVSSATTLHQAAFERTTATINKR